MIFLALTGLAVVRRLDGRDRDAADAAVEALEAAPRRRSAPPRQPRRSPSRRRSTATAACCTVLGCIAADAGRAEQAAQLLGHAAHLRTEAGVPEPPFLSDDVARATDAATVLLGPDGFAAAYRVWSGRSTGR